MQGSPNYNEQEFNKLYVDQWNKLTNADNQTINHFFVKPTNGEYKVTIHLAKLFRQYEDYEDLTNKQKMQAQDWADLIRELNSIKGVSMDLDNSISDPEVSSVDLFLREYIIPASRQGGSYLQDFRIQDLKGK